MEKVIVDVTVGTRQRVPLTPEEQAGWEQRSVAGRAAAQQAEQSRITREQARAADKTQRASLVPSVTTDYNDLTAGAGNMNTNQRIARLEAALARADNLILALERAVTRSDL